MGSYIPFSSHEFHFFYFYGELLIAVTHSPFCRESRTNSGVSILKVLTMRKLLIVLRSMTGLCLLFGFMTKNNQL